MDLYLKKTTEHLLNHEKKKITEQYVHPYSIMDTYRVMLCSLNYP